MAIQDSPPGSPAPPTGTPAQDAAALRLRMAHMGREMAVLRAAAATQAGLSAQLREANQNLVLANLAAQNLRELAERANARQNEFLAMLAHELRNPLAPISLANTMLAKLPDAPVGVFKLHAIIHRQVQHLTRLLDDLLDAARISSGKIALLRSPLPLVELLQRAVQTVQLRLVERRQQIVLDLPDELVVNGDPVRLAQVFSNLLVNASKYTGDGGLIRLAARAQGGHAVVTVADNGVGMGVEVLRHAFDLFTQGPRELARAEGGLGVGLNVVRNIVGLHGGGVTAASDGLGCGSVFSVTLPLADGPQAAPELPRSTAVPRQRRILLVEDNLDANDVLGSLLTAEGHVVTAAYDGIAGLRLAQERMFDVLICDIGLPGMDGLELLARLRQRPGAHLPFAIAISGYGQAEDRNRAVAAGYGHYFVKPVDADFLLALVASDIVSRFIGQAVGQA
ncbi:MAG: ATP-binding protein [Massilia sp.]